VNNIPQAWCWLQAGRGAARLVCCMYVQLREEQIRTIRAYAQEYIQLAHTVTLVTQVHVTRKLEKIFFATSNS
jgi:hypothetical protein